MINTICYFIGGNFRKLAPKINPETSGYSFLILVITYHYERISRIAAETRLQYTSHMSSVWHGLWYASARRLSTYTQSRKCDRLCSTLAKKQKQRAQKLMSPSFSTLFPGRFAVIPWGGSRCALCFRNILAEAQMGNFARALNDNNLSAKLSCYTSVKNDNETSNAFFNKWFARNINQFITS